REPTKPRSVFPYGLGNLCFDLLHGLDFGLDLDAVADHHAAGFEHLVPREPEVLAIDRRLRAERRAQVAPWILRLAELFDAKDDLARNPLDREVTHDVD